MKGYYSILTLTLITLYSATLASVPVKNISTRVKEVTIFVKGAQVSRNGLVSLEKGEAKVLISGLSPYIESSSVQIKTQSNVQIHTVRFTVNYLENLATSKELKTLNNNLEALNKKLRGIDGTYHLLEEDEDFLRANRKIRSDQSGISLDQLSSIYDYQRQQFANIFHQKNELNERKELVLQEIESIKDQLRRSKFNEKTPVGEIEVMVKALQKVDAQFSISYLVKEAGWYPAYDIRVQDVNSPVVLAYKAKIYQNSGEQWKKVKLTVSTGNPNESQQKPELRPWFVGYHAGSYTDQMRSYGQSHEGVVTGQVTDEEGKPLPGVNVMVKGTTVGTVTDINGRYSIYCPSSQSAIVYSFIGMSTEEVKPRGSIVNLSMSADVKQLQEVVVTGYSSRVRGVKRSKKAEIADVEAYTEPSYTQISSQFTINEPISLASGVSDESVLLAVKELQADYEYALIPKISNKAYLMAYLVDWEDQSWLEGQTSVFFEDTYVGNMIFSPANFGDTLQLSLGTDKSISLQREKITKKQKRQSIGNHKIDSRKLEIRIKNNKAEDVKINVYDQIPVSTMEEIEVIPTDLNQADIDNESGIIHWKRSLHAKKDVNLSFSYQVKYPKNRVIRLE